MDFGNVTAYREALHFSTSRTSAQNWCVVWHALSTGRAWLTPTRPSSTQGVPPRSRLIDRGSGFFAWMYDSGAAGSGANPFRKLSNEWCAFCRKRGSFGGTV